MVSFSSLSITTWIPQLKTLLNQPTQLCVACKKCWARFPFLSAPTLVILCHDLIPSSQAVLLFSWPRSNWENGVNKTVHFVCYCAKFKMRIWCKTIMVESGCFRFRKVIISRIISKLWLITFGLYQELLWICVQCSEVFRFESWLTFPAIHTARASYDLLLLFLVRQQWSNFSQYLVEVFRILRLNFWNKCQNLRLPFISIRLINYV